MSKQKLTENEQKHRGPMMLTFFPKCSKANPTHEPSIMPETNSDSADNVHKLSNDNPSIETPVQRNPVILRKQSPLRIRMMIGVFKKNG